MKSVSRREFIARTGAAAAALLLSKPARIFAASESASLVLKNGIIITMDDKIPLAEALAVKGNRLIAVGTNKSIEPLISTDTQVLDLGGKCVSPGIIDAHSHLAAFGHMELEFVNLRPPKVSSFATLNMPRKS